MTRRTSSRNDRGFTVKAEPLVLQNVCDGKIADKFNDAVSRIRDDFADRPEVDAKRTVTIKIEMSLDDSGYLNMDGAVTVSLPANKVSGLGKIGNNGEMLQLVDDQGKLPLDEENVVKIDGRKEKKQ